MYLINHVLFIYKVKKDKINKFKLLNIYFYIENKTKNQKQNVQTFI